MTLSYIWEFTPRTIQYDSSNTESMLQVTNWMYLFSSSRLIVCSSEQFVISVIGIFRPYRYLTSSMKSGRLVGSPPSMIHQIQYLSTLSKIHFHWSVVRSFLLASFNCPCLSESPNGHIGQK